MRLDYQALVGIEEFQNAFPVTLQPAIAQADYVTNFTENSTTSSYGVKVDPLINALYPHPVFIPFNQTYSGSTSIVDNGVYVRSGLPSIAYDSIDLSGPGTIQAFAYRPWSYQHYDVLCTNESSADQMKFLAHATVSTAGFAAFISKNHWQNIAVNPENTAFWSIKWVVDGTWFRVHCEAQKPPQLDVAPDGEEWRTINAKLRDNSSPVSTMGNSSPHSNNDAIYLEVLALNGQLEVSLGGSSSPFIVALQNPYPEITEVQFEAQNFTQFSPHLHPIQFTNDMELQSADKTFGSVPITPYRFAVSTPLNSQSLQDGQTFTENGWTISISAINGWSGIPRYLLGASIRPDAKYNGAGYTSKPLAICRIQMILDGVFHINPYNPRAITTRAIRESIRFDPSKLSISHTMQVTLSNFAGIDWWEENYGLRRSGNQHITMRLGWQHMNPEGDGGVGWQHFYGIITGRRFLQGPGAAGTTLTLTCVDQMQQLQDVLIGNPPNMDGWNHYAGVAWYAMAARLSPLQFGFAAMVPTINGGNMLDNPGDPIDPFAYSAYDPDPYFLPLGEGLHPWSPRDRSLPCLSGILQIRAATGFLLFIDRHGYLRYEEWIPPLSQPVYKYFNEVPTSDVYADGGDLSEMFSLEFRTSTDDTRNQVVTVGINSYSSDWDPIVIKREDPYSIYVPDGVTPPYNYVGYPKAFTWLDSRFANSLFADRANANMFRFMSLPELSVSGTSWLQPDVFPLQTIGVNNGRAGTGGIPFYVMGIDNTVSAMGGNFEFSSSFSGRFLI